MRWVKLEGLDRGYVEMLIGNCLCQMLTRYYHFDFFYNTKAQGRVSCESLKRNIYSDLVACSVKACMLTLV